MAGRGCCSIHLPPGFVPLSIDSPLPGRLEPDSRLRMQVRPGTWTVEIVARHEGPVASLTRPDAQGPWKEGDEVWVFEARPSLRVAAVASVPAIDPQQTTLPDEWKKLPAYAMSPGATMRLDESRRGDSEPAPDRLSLSRTLWLDFDGGGYTVSDTITGSMYRGWRIEMTMDRDHPGQACGVDAGWCLEDLRHFGRHQPAFALDDAGEVG